jgi:PhzF family phenazine biosynthesis protein
MRLTLYHLDSFTDRLFGGNPAAVIPLDNWINDNLMQQVAMENNLSDTAFFVPSEMSQAFEAQPEADFDIRWFTPGLEINLCGHATLATAYLLFNILNHHKSEIRFLSKSGMLTTKRNGDIISMDFPAWKPAPFHDRHNEFSKALGGIKINSLYKNRDVLIELDDEDAVSNCKPDFELIKKTGEMVIITARGKEADFVSRFFCPAAGMNEDPVTGSAHSQLIPYWAERLGKQTFFAKQLSKRGGDLWCELLGDRVTIGGKCVFYMKGEIEI